MQLLIWLGLSVSGEFGFLGGFFDYFYFTLPLTGPPKRKTPFVSLASVTT